MMLISQTPFVILVIGKQPTEIIYEISSFQTWYKQWNERLKRIINLGILLRQ